MDACPSGGSFCRGNHAAGTRNCCRVTTSLPGEPVLVCLPRPSGVSGILCWSTGLDLVCPFRYWMGLLLLLDQASCSWSRLNSPLLWLWGLLWLFTAPALGEGSKVCPSSRELEPTEELSWLSWWGSCRNPSLDSERVGVSVTDLRRSRFPSFLDLISFLIFRVLVLVSRLEAAVLGNEGLVLGGLALVQQLQALVVLEQGLVEPLQVLALFQHGLVLVLQGRLLDQQLRVLALPFSPVITALLIVQETLLVQANFLKLRLTSLSSLSTRIAFSRSASSSSLYTLAERASDSSLLILALASASSTLRCCRLSVRFMPGEPHGDCVAEA
ncbi:hypothetical protein DV515_00004253 [Chloebia gouldiae]|uniref:Uncharacterized protein n=1 Tax=Chloebia gouldiae TaxID=44316 RepID=A0A3L8SRS4_CHLGU|nr:hypothetical protein DV515_00004253 [Chloebia gouldiae]